MRGQKKMAENDNVTTDTTTTTQAQEFIVMKNPITSEEISVPKNLQPYIQDIVRFNKQSGKQTMETENTTLKEQLETLTNQFNEFKETAGKKKAEPEEDVIKKYNEVIDGLTAKLNQSEEDKQKTLKEYQNQKISNDLHSALAAFEANSGSQVHNKNQLVELMKVVNGATLKENIDLSTGTGLGTFETVLNIVQKDESGATRPVELSAIEAVSTFLSMDENSFHLKNKLTAGGGTRNGNSNHNNNDKFDQAYLEASKNKDLNGQIAAKQAEYEAMNK